MLLLVTTSCDGQEETSPLPINTVSITLSTGNTVEVPAQQVISAGSNHTLVVKGDGTVWAFGNNEHGQLGNGTTEASLEPVQVEGLRDVVKVSAGRRFSAALDAHGQLWMWGLNEDGQLGNSTRETKLRPVGVLEEVSEVATGNSATLALRDDGTLLGWGLNLDGNFGLSDRVGRFLLTPTPIQERPDVRAIGRPKVGVVVVQADGDVWAWGDSVLTEGEIDIGDREFPNPKRIKHLSSICSISTGTDYALALTCSGEVWAWGDNWIGQLGVDETTDPRFKPTRMQALEGRTIVAVAAYYKHSLALDSDGQVWGWGNNDYRPIPVTDLTITYLPAQFPTLGNIVAIAAGVDSTIALDKDGKVWAVGYSGVGDKLEDEEIVYSEPHLVMTR